MLRERETVGRKKEDHMFWEWKIGVMACLVAQSSLNWHLQKRGSVCLSVIPNHL